MWQAKIGRLIGFQGVVLKQLLRRAQCKIFVLDKEGPPPDLPLEVRAIVLLGSLERITAAAVDIDHVLSGRNLLPEGGGQLLPSTGSSPPSNGWPAAHNEHQFAGNNAAAWEGGAQDAAQQAGVGQVMLVPFHPQQMVVFSQPQAPSYQPQQMPQQMHYTAANAYAQPAPYDAYAQPAPYSYAPQAPPYMQAAQFPPAQPAPYPPHVQSTPYHIPQQSVHYPHQLYPHQPYSQQPYSRQPAPYAAYSPTLHHSQHPAYPAAP